MDCIRRLIGPLMFDLQQGEPSRAGKVCSWRSEKSHARLGINAFNCLSARRPRTALRLASSDRLGSFLPLAVSGRRRARYRCKSSTRGSEGLPFARGVGQIATFAKLPRLAGRIVAGTRTSSGKDPLAQFSFQMRISVVKVTDHSAQHEHTSGKGHRLICQDLSHWCPHARAWRATWWTRAEK